MKLLVISNLYPPHEIGGYEIRCRDICERLRDLGHDIHVLTSDHHIAGRPEISEPHVTRGLKIHGMYGHSWLPIQKLYALEKHNVAAVHQAIADFKPDLVHVWNMGGISKTILHPLENGSIPMVYDVSDHWIARSIRHDVWLAWWNAPGSSARNLARTLLGLTGIRRLIDKHAPTFSPKLFKFKNIYFCSAFMRDFSAAEHWPVGHAAVIHCGIDTAAFSVKQSQTRFKKLLWVGRLSADKDPLTAVRALAAAHRKGLTQLTLDLYGHGEPDYVALVDAEIAKLGLTQHVQRKLAPSAEMRQLYAYYDALLFTSNWGEPFALTPLEAMASGLPVITSLDGGQPELADHGVNCLVAAAADPELYATRLVEMEAAPKLREKIAKTGLTQVRAQFDLAPITRQIEAFLLAALRS
jgi:glycogen synthase